MPYKIKLSFFEEEGQKESSKNLPMKVEEGDKISALDHKAYRPVDHLSIDQQKFIMMCVNSSFTEGEVAKRLGIKPKLLRSWQQDPHFAAYYKECMNEIYDDKIKDKAKKQMNQLNDLSYMNLMQRFEYIDESKLDPSMTIEQREAFLKRYVQFMPAIDAAKMHDMLHKNLAKSVEDAGQKAGKVEIMETIQATFERKSKEDAAWTDEFAKHGIDPMKPFVPENVIDIGEKKSEDNSNKDSLKSISLTRTTITKRDLREDDDER